MTRRYCRGVKATPPATMRRQPSSGVSLDSLRGVLGCRMGDSCPSTVRARRRPGHGGCRCRRRSCRPADSRRSPRPSASASPSNRSRACPGRRPPRCAWPPAAPARSQRPTRRSPPGSRFERLRVLLAPEPRLLQRRSAPTCSRRWVTGVVCLVSLHHQQDPDDHRSDHDGDQRPGDRTPDALGGGMELRSGGHAISRLPVGLAATLAFACACSRARSRLRLTSSWKGRRWIGHRERSLARQLDHTVRRRMINVPGSSVNGSSPSSRHLCSRHRCPPATRSSSTATRATPTRCSSGPP